MHAWNVENAVKRCSDAVQSIVAHGPSFVALSVTALQDVDAEDAAGELPVSAFLSLTCCQWLLSHLCSSYRCSISPHRRMISRSILPRHVPTLTSLPNFASDETALKARLAFPHCLTSQLHPPPQVPEHIDIEQISSTRPRHLTSGNVAAISKVERPSRRTCWARGSAASSGGSMSCSGGLCGEVIRRQASSSSSALGDTGV